jgi:hypothetical protein
MEVAKSVEVVADATVTPTAVNRKERTYSGCVYDSEGKVVRISQRSNEAGVTWRHDDPDVLSRGPRARNVDGRSVYLGHYSGHYGHFLMETLSRFWVLADDAPFDAVVFQPFVHEVPRPADFAPARAALACFGIDEERVVFADQPLRAAELTVPSALCVINVGAHPDQALVYRRIASCCTERYTPDAPTADKLYISRSAFNGFQPVTNEHEVEEMFASLGFAVIHPERLTFEEQVVAFGAADVVAGFTGSGMHNSVFMREGSLAMSIGHLRRLRPDEPVPNQLICDNLAGVRTAFVPFEGELVDERKRTGRIDVHRLRAAVEAQLS